MRITVLRNRKVMQQLQPNTTLQGGKYKIERVLGQGGFGITYLATQMSLQRQVAIKEFFMKDFCGRDERTKMVSAPTTGSNRLVDQYRKKFTKEARNLAKLNHPNIINVIDVFEENGTVYYAMPYLSGGSLDDYVRLHGALDESEAMKYVKQIARALKYMHEEHHICHYDVKPANILLDDKGNAVLIDFGISKNYDASGHETSTTPIGLSEGYAPIEQYQQSVEEFSPVSDVYALGATLYFLLHGKRPVNAPSRAGGTSLLMKKDLSPDTKNLISSTMKISKTERSQTMDVFLKEREIVESSYHHEDTDVGKIVFLVIIACLIIGGVVYYYTGGSGGNVSEIASVVSERDSSTFEKNVVVNKPFILKGKIADNIRFTMHLSIKDNLVEGTEHYDSQEKDAAIQIKGIIDSNGTMNLDEYDDNVKTGSYRGVFSADSYSGSFINKLGKEFIFSSIVIDEADYSFKLKQKEQAIKDSYLSIIDTHFSKDQDDEWFYLFLKYMDQIRVGAKKIGNAQRTFFQFFFRELLNRDADSYGNLLSAINIGFRRYDSQAN